MKASSVKQIHEIFDTLSSSFTALIPHSVIEETRENPNCNEPYYNFYYLYFSIYTLHKDLVKRGAYVNMLANILKLRGYSIQIAKDMIVITIVEK